MRAHLATRLLTWGLRLLPDGFATKPVLANVIVDVCREHLSRVRAAASLRKSQR
jgi:hypothetical protein